MSAELPAEVPSEIRGQLCQEPTPRNAVPLITVDDHGFPHAALISYSELIYLHSFLCFFIGAGSRSSRFIRKRRLCTLLFIHNQIVCYLKGEAHWLGNFRSHAVYRFRLKSVLKDSPRPEEAGISLQTGIRFAAHPDALDKARRFKETIREFLERHSKKLPGRE